MAKRKVSNLRSLDKKISDEIAQKVKKNNVESTVFRDNVNSTKANYLMGYRREERDVEFVCYTKVNTK